MVWNNLSIDPGVDLLSADMDESLNMWALILSPILSSC